METLRRPITLANSMSGRFMHTTVRRLWGFPKMGRADTECPCSMKNVVMQRLLGRMTPGVFESWLGPDSSNRPRFSFGVTEVAVFPTKPHSFPVAFLMKASDGRNNLKQRF